MAHNFYLYAKQDGGCDYTIACGETLELMEAETFDEAVVEAEQWVRENEHEGYREFSRVDILHAAVTPVDLAGIRCKVIREEEGARRAEIEQRERAELERLRAKYDTRP